MIYFVSFKIIKKYVRTDLSVLKILSIFVYQIKNMDVKSRIIDTASRLFYKQGYNSTGINQVIKEAEVAKASLYQYFPSKEDLLIEYLNVTSRVTKQQLELVVSQFENPKDKVLGIFDFLIEMTESTSFNGCNFLNISAELPQENTKVTELIKAQKDSIRNLFTRILDNEQKEELADELYVLFDAALVSSKVYQSSWPVKTARKIAEKLL